MIIFLKPELQQIEVYTKKGSETFSFDEIDDLCQLYKNHKSFLYITNAVKADFEQLTDLVNQFEIDESTYDDSAQYLQAQTSRTLVLDQVKGSNGEPLTFRGSGDCLLIDEHIINLLETNKSLQHMIKTGYLNVVSHREMIRAFNKQNRLQSREIQKKQSLEDQQLDSILVKDGVSAEDIAAGATYDDDASPIDITDEVKNMREEDLEASDIAGLFSDE